MRIDTILDYVNTIIQIVLNTQWCDLIRFCKHVQTCSTQTWRNTFILSKLQTKWHTTTKLFLGPPCSESIWYELIQFLNMSRLEIKTWRNTLKFEQMAHEKAKGQQAKKLFLGSLRASQAIKKSFKKTSWLNWITSEMSWNTTHLVLSWNWN